MTSKRFAGREFLLMTLPCALLLLIGSYLTHRPSPPAPLPTPTPTTFLIEVKRFKLEPVDAENKKAGADTCMTVQTLTHNEPPNVRWFYCRRLVATRNGKTRMLWYDMMPGTGENPELRRHGSLGGGYHTTKHLFKLRNVPLERGQITFLWDALAQPVGQTVTFGNEKFVSIAELQRAAKWGGLRLSRRLVLRRDLLDKSKGDIRKR